MKIKSGKKLCDKCGAELKQNARFCQKCGSRVADAINEESFIERVKNGDTTAWEELYKNTYPRAYSVAIQTLRNREDALDVLQDAYVSVFKNINSIQDDTKVNAWVNKIVANRCIDYIRKYKGDKATVSFEDMLSTDSNMEFEDIIEKKDNWEFTPEESVDYSETKRIMQDILNQLSKEQRLCVLMYYYDELSIKEIAETLGCSTGTVKSRLNYARKHIKKEVENQEKKGTKLYSIAPIPFILWMLRNQENAIQTKAVEPTLWKSIQKKAGVTKQIGNAANARKATKKTADNTVKAAKKVVEKTATSSKKSQAENAAGKVVGAVAKTGAKGITTKIAAGATVCALAGTGVGIGYKKTHLIPKDAVEYNDHYYKIITGTYTWSEAEKECEKMGGHLVTITSDQEQNFVNGLNDSGICVWIGGTRNKENGWNWVTGEEWKYENWAPGEPNDSLNVVSDENRVAIWNSIGQWNDLNDANTYEQNGFVCEWE